MARLVLYLIIKPLSLLPYWLLYSISDVFYLLIYHVVRYRRSIVQKNLSHSFPDLSNSARKKIEKASYAHFVDLMVESIKSFSIKESQALKRAIVVNPEVVDQYYEQGRSVIIVAGHYANWEIQALTLDTWLKHKVAALFMPLKNEYFNKKVYDSRSQFGMILLPRTEVAEFYQSESQGPSAMVFIADQSPAFKQGKRIYWTKFMNQDTPIAYGPEKYARDYNLPVIFAAISKRRRGYYEVTFSLIEDDPSSTAEYEITEKHVRRLEEQIRQEPRYYLWTHNRWKHQKPIKELNQA